MLIKDPINTKSKFAPKQYCITARKAFHTILSELDFGEDKKLLLPAYIGITDREGSGVFDPVMETKTPYEFYELDSKLSAKKNELYDKIKSGKYNSLLMIHYFGFCQNNMEELVQLCKEHDVVLIEDCAHSMLSCVNGKELGGLGDFSIYSLHKFLPTDIGGCLRINNKDFLYLLDKPIDHKYIKGSIDVVVKSDLKAIQNKRRQNYQELLKLIKEIHGLEIMYPELPTGISPHNFPILIKNKQREAVYFKLIENKVPVIALYYRMIEPILAGDFQDSKFISENILNLPIHQDIETEDLRYMANQLKKALQ